MKVPRYVLFVDALPHTPTHKVAKMALRQDPTLKQRAIDLQAKTQGSPAMRPERKYQEERDSCVSGILRPARRSRPSP